MCVQLDKETVRTVEVQPGDFAKAPQLIDGSKFELLPPTNILGGVDSFTPLGKLQGGGCNYYVVPPLPGSDKKNLVVQCMGSSADVEKELILASEKLSEAGCGDQAQISVALAQARRGKSVTASEICIAEPDASLELIIQIMMAKSIDDLAAEPQSAEGAGAVAPETIVLVENEVPAGAGGILPAEIVPTEVVYFENATREQKMKMLPEMILYGFGACMVGLGGLFVAFMALGSAAAGGGKSPYERVNEREAERSANNSNNQPPVIAQSGGHGPDWQGALETTDALLANIEKQQGKRFTEGVYTKLRKPGSKGDTVLHKTVKKAMEKGYWPW